MPDAVGREGPWGSPRLVVVPHELVVADHGLPAHEVGQIPQVLLHQSGQPVQVFHVPPRVAEPPELLLRGGFAGVELGRVGVVFGVGQFAARVQAVVAVAFGVGLREALRQRPYPPPRVAQAVLLPRGLGLDLLAQHVRVLDEPQDEPAHALLRIHGGVVFGVGAGGLTPPVGGAHVVEVQAGGPADRVGFETRPALAVAEGLEVPRAIPGVRRLHVVPEPLPGGLHPLSRDAGFRHGHGDPLLPRLRHLDLPPVGGGLDLVAVVPGDPGGPARVEARQNVRREVPRLHHGPELLRGVRAVGVVENHVPEGGGVPVGRALGRRHARRVKGTFHGP